MSSPAQDPGPSGLGTSPNRTTTTSSATRITSSPQSSTIDLSKPRPPPPAAALNATPFSPAATDYGFEANSLFSRPGQTPTNAAAPSLLGAAVNLAKPPPMSTARLKKPSRGLSLNIPPGSQAYGGLTPVSSLGSADAPPVSAVDTQAPRLVSSNEQYGAGISGASLAPPPAFAQRPLSAKRRPARLNLGGDAPASSSSAAFDASSSRSVPSSPSMSRPPPLPSKMTAAAASGLTTIAEQEKHELRDTLTGKPRRRPSMPFGPHARVSTAQSAAGGVSTDEQLQPPEVWRDPSQDILSGQGSTLQHARSVYAAGPIEVLPGLYLGDEHNARDNSMLASCGITTILNVAKETTLPFQTESNVMPLRKGRHGLWPAAGQATQTEPADSTLRPRNHRANTVSSDELFHTPPSASIFSPAGLGPRTPLSAATDISIGSATEMYMTPISESPPPMLPQSASSHLLRNSLSTPNLQVQFQKPAATQQTHSTGSSDASEEGGKGSSLYSSEAPPSDQTHLTEEDSNGDLTEVDDPEILYSAVELPEDALKLSIPASPSTGRAESIRYIKLPWTHDQTELAAPKGGFAQGCAVISEAMAIDHYGRPLFDDEGRPLKPGNVLVHCQCGVSRSATLVIAFVMQAAALNYPYEATKTLTGMHDCYNLVKDLSSSISPNISLIYQLVEWERHLSAEAIRLRDALQRRSSQRSATTAATLRPEEGAGHNGNGHATSGVGDTVLPSGVVSDAMPRPAAVGWSSEAMDEEEWTRMRMEEERKEQVEDEDRRRRLQEEAARQGRERRAREQQEADAAGSVGGLPATSSSPLGLSGSGGGGGGGIGARRKKKTPALRLGSSGSSGSRPSSSEGLSEPSGSLLPSNTLPPLPSARLDGAFPGREAPQGGSDAAKNAQPDELARRVPTLSISGGGSSEAPSSGSSKPLPALPSPRGGTQSSLRPSLSSPSTVAPTRPISLPPPPASAVSATSASASPMASTSSTPAKLSSSTSTGSTTSSSSTNTLLLPSLPSAKPDFGHAHTSAAERKKQHRRTFSSEPTSSSAMVAAALLSSMESIRSAAVASGRRPSEVVVVPGQQGQGQQAGAGAGAGAAAAPSERR